MNIETIETNRAQVTHHEHIVTLWSEMIAAVQEKLNDETMPQRSRSAACDDLRFATKMLKESEADLAAAKSALDAVPSFIDDEQTMPRLVLVHSAEPVRETVAEHAKPDDDARAWCGTLLDQHTSKCVDCHDRMLERAVLAMGGSDNSVFRTDKDGHVKKSYLYLPNADLVDAGFVCTWSARSSCTAALLDYIRGHRDWSNRLVGEMPS